MLDTGSQVTSIAKSFYDRHLFNQIIEPIEDIVRVVGAGGQDVPFLGYVTIHVSFPENDVGIRSTLTTLALVLPNNSYNQRVPVIIGTNLVKQYRNACQQIAGQNFLQTAKVSSAWKRVYQFVQSQDRFLQRQDSFGAKVKSTSRHPTTIASHETKILMGLANSCPGSLTQAVVETSTGSDQVAGIVVTPGLVTVGPHKSSCRVPVEITNNTDHTVVIPAKAVLASLKIAKDVITPTATGNTATMISAIYLI